MEAHHWPLLPRHHARATRKRVPRLEKRGPLVLEVVRPALVVLADPADPGVDGLEEQKLCK